MADNGDRRMHQGRKPGLEETRGHERHEESIDGIGERRAAAEGGDVSDDRARDQQSALGGDVATRSNTRETPPEDRVDTEGPA